MTKQVKEIDVIIADTLSEHNKLTTKQWYDLLHLPKELTKGKTELQVNNEIEYHLMSENIKLILAINKILDDNNEFEELEYKCMEKYTQDIDNNNKNSEVQE